MHLFFFFPQSFQCHDPILQFFILLYLLLSFITLSFHMHSTFSVYHVILVIKIKDILALLYYTFHFCLKFLNVLASPKKSIHVSRKLSCALIIKLLFDKNEFFLDKTFFTETSANNLDNCSTLLDNCHCAVSIKCLPLVVGT